MTPEKTYSKRRRKRFLSIRKAAFQGAIFLSLSAFMMSCSNGSDNSQAINGGGSWDSEKSVGVAKQDFTKGVITTIEETEKDKFTIVDEQIVPKKEDSRVIVRKLGGEIDTMTLAQAQTVANNDPNTNKEEYRSGGSGMGNILMWGVMGYFLGRNMSRPINSGAYKNQQTYQRVNSTTNTQAMQSRKTVGRPTQAKGTGGQTKATNNTQTKSTTSQTKPTPTTKTTPTAKPTNSSKGFFNNGSRSNRGNSGRSRTGG
ncbi:MAG: hypothetical protein ACPG5B_02695 [Chitinophagales bacterium]